MATHTIMHAKDFLSSTPAMNSIRYSPAKPADADAIIRLLAQSFSEREPPAVAMGLSFDDLHTFLQLNAPEIISKGLSIAGRDEEHGQIVAAALVSDFSVASTIHVDGIHKNFLPILSMLGALDAGFSTGKTILPGQYLHIFMLGVDQKASGFGVGQRLIQVALAQGLNHGFQSAVAEATGGVSQHCFRKCGFVDRVKISYRDYVYDKQKVFASIRENDGAILMELPAMGTGTMPQSGNQLKR
ncbi:MAG TPA: GNAT family N-acetyltransferase [Candidatus Angelobacter sp.]|nr:GNAT family N-acetyltransferase [Candidatus Angelobacter sp.]